MNSQRSAPGNYTIQNLFGTDSDTETDDSITSESELEDRTTDEDSMDAHGDTVGFSGEHAWEGGARTSTSASMTAVTSALQETVEDAETIAHQQDLRKRIMAIQSNDGFSAMEKAKKIQELMTSNWNTTQRSQSSRAALASNKLEHRRADFSVVTDHDKQRTYHDKDALILGCKHYQRAAKLQAHCCGKWYTCRFCHDEVSDHNIVRNLTSTMMCMYCSTVQPAGRDCANVRCGKRVAKYYCPECKLWDDDPRKNIYHCHDCGICRIGKGLGQDYFHCKRCNVCMAISLKGNHKCIERNLESDCPICGEYMFTSTTTVIFMPCGHCIHYKCHQEYIQTSYQCPTCFKSLANMSEYFKRIDAMLAQHQMPPEYATTRSHVYCNDCENKSFAKFHFLYHKCGKCGGYNTKVLRTCQAGEEDLILGKQVGVGGVVAAAEGGAGEDSGGGGEAGGLVTSQFDISPPFFSEDQMDVEQRRGSLAVEGGDGAPMVAGNGYEQNH